MCKPIVILGSAIPLDQAVEEELKQVLLDKTLLLGSKRAQVNLIQELFEKKVPG